MVDPRISMVLINGGSKLVRAGGALTASQVGSVVLTHGDSDRQATVADAHDVRFFLQETNPHQVPLISYVNREDGHNMRSLIFGDESTTQNFQNCDKNGDNTSAVDTHRDAENKSSFLPDLVRIAARMGEERRRQKRDQAGADIVKQVMADEQVISATRRQDSHVVWRVASR